MYYSSQTIFRALSVIGILLGTSSCTQETMIRINATSSAKLLPNTEIRFKACGESPDSCKEIFEKINRIKIDLTDINYKKYIEHTSIQSKASADIYRKNRENEKCIKIGAENLGLVGFKQECAVPMPNYIQFVELDKNKFQPNEEDSVKIIKEVSISTLHEYTFSKSDGSIVVICPTRFCAISSADGGWIGIGERGKPNELTSLISN